MYVPTVTFIYTHIIYVWSKNGKLKGKISWTCRTIWICVGQPKGHEPFTKLEAYISLTSSHHFILPQFNERHRIWIL